MANQDEYETRNGINYRKTDDYALCDRCGGRPIVNNKCLICDVDEPTEEIKKLASLIASECFRRSQDRIAGFQDARHESFNITRAAKIIQASL